MASHVLLLVAKDPVLYTSVLLLAVVCLVTLIAATVRQAVSKPGAIAAYAHFVWSCFIKPHTGDGNGSQQEALESFYKAQAHVYDVTRARLLCGREDMLGLAASHLRYRHQSEKTARKPVWVDIGGGTGSNIEAMGKLLDVTSVFSAVYLVDLSPSLCAIAKARFARLGWNNVKVLCQDARAFDLASHNKSRSGMESETDQTQGAELITMSYALSMIPDFYSVIDSISEFLAPTGIIGVCDFYVQSMVDYQSRNYVGGAIDRHCNWLSRVFWRTWFEIDRVSLEPARRDYLEYRFGTIVSLSARNHIFGVRIPYYVWLGCPKATGTSAARLAEVDAVVTESPFLAALDLQAQTLHRTAETFEKRSKAYECAVINIASSLPLPASWYQNHHWRIYYDEQLQKHRQFGDEYIYAFTWEDSRVDARLLKVQPDDVILSITSAGDNILAFALQRPKRLHAVDLNPNQNHLLELKVAAFTALGYSDVWKLFGDGKHEDFRRILISKLSPHISSFAFQYWLHHGPSAFSGGGLYCTGGSRHALVLLGWLFRLLGLHDEVKRLCSAQTLNEQREIWQRSIRKVILSRILSWAVIGNEKWLWKALGVPPAQRSMIEQDYVKQDDLHANQSLRSGHAIWEYVINTLEPVVNNTLLSEDNHYYQLCLQRHYSRRSHPEYLTPKAHIKLSQPGAFDGLRIHTDEIQEVLHRMTKGTLTIAVVMDSMDWFDPQDQTATRQIKALNRALKMKGRVLLRSAGLSPWYIKTFEELGFEPKRVGNRIPGSCIDRVNMYASTWICTKIREMEEPKGANGHKYQQLADKLPTLMLGHSAMEPSAW